MIVFTDLRSFSVVGSVTNLALDFAYLVDETNSLKVGVFVRSRTLVNENSDSNESYFGIYLKTDLFNYYYDR